MGVESDAQDEVIRGLESGRLFGVAADRVERIDTHISVVFLAGDRAYKLKRAVRFDFLDFSTPDKRHAACEAELRVNRRSAPALYLGLRAVTREADGTLGLDGSGPVLDWLVEMGRFDQDDLFDRMARRGALGAAEIEALAAEIAGLHAIAEVHRERGGAAGMARLLDQLASGLPAAGLGGDVAGTLVERLRDELAFCGRTLDARREAGFVRQAHGDLHLANICLVEGRPTLFDAIEFNDDIACIDLLYDLAFPVMDLWHHGARDLSNALLNHYLGRTGDVGGMAAMPLFLGCRAGVRAMVLGFAASAAGGEASRAERTKAARGYLAAARSLTERSPARLIAVGGLSGSGKSTLARRLAPHIGRTPGAVVLRSDMIRKELMGVAPDRRLGPDGYAPEISARVYEAMARRATAVLASGYCAVADAVYARPDERSEIAGVAEAAGVPFTGFWLTAPRDTLAERIEARRGDASDATVAVLDSQLEYELGVVDWTEIDTSAGADATEKAANATLARRRGADG